MKKKIVLIGGGGHCKSCIDVIETDAQYHIAGIVDLNEKIGDKILGYEIIASDNELSELLKKYSNFFITIGHIKNPNKRIALFEMLVKQGAYFSESTKRIILLILSSITFSSILL